ncbi:MAG TPA: tetraacyldisaccharide 4'-kinase [Acidobacteriaceae bacterium]|nr:tetraacyldisaccharide 4'-kinase [Acidobacteriaceae bacterium]
MTRPWLAPLEVLYAAAVRRKNARFDRSVPRRLNWPVVSVGNLSMGGSGKTPLVIRLAQLFGREGWGVDVLSRGYGRRQSRAERVCFSDDPAQDAAQFGDEPLLIAQEAGVPVFVGASRYEAGQLAEREEPGTRRRLHLLDDAFQHRQLGREVDIVVLHRGDLGDRLLPSGRLREPLASLRRANVIVLREEDSDLIPRLRPYLRSGTPIWLMRRRLLLRGIEGRTLAFCAIARPAEFFAAIESAGIELAARVNFRDHHRYTLREMQELSRRAARLGCAQFVTTEKDAIKLGSELRNVLAETAPLRVVKLVVELADEDAAVEQLGTLLAAVTPF